MIGDTLADPEHAHALPRITVDEPAISVTIGTNTSPLAGKVSGHKLTARMVKSRLDTELVGNRQTRVGRSADHHAIAGFATSGLRDQLFAEILQHRRAFQRTQGISSEVRLRNKRRRKSIREKPS